MRYLCTLKADESTEAGDPPSMELMEQMGAFVEEGFRSGFLVATEGLQPTSKGMRAKYENGTLSVTDGPFTESKEVIASFALVEAESKEQLLHWTERFLALIGGGEIEIRPTYAAEDLLPPEEAAKENALRAEMDAKARG